MFQNSPCYHLTPSGLHLNQNYQKIFSIARFVTLITPFPRERIFANRVFGSSSDCSFCLRPESLLHVVAGCQHYLERFTWRHDSILNFLANNLQSVNGCKIVLWKPLSYNWWQTTPRSSSLHLYIVELTVGFETNLTNNVIRKKSKYKDLVRKQKENFGTVKFINLSISALGIFDKECHNFLEMLNDLDLDKKCQNYYIRNIINIAIRTTYFIFCCRNKKWTNPDLLNN